MKIIRRTLPLGILPSVPSTWAQPATPIEVFKISYCGCCEKWFEHLQQNGFRVKAQNVSDFSAVRRAAGLPDRFSSDHMAKIGNYLVEGRVPVADIRRLIAVKPKALGLAIPSMSPGSPGMKSAKPIPYETLLVQADGSYRTFAKH